uniref:Odorant binging protein n=1 Tax=Agrilus zanthoxylumi TaxID=2696312 RepID=A0A8A6I1K8_9COLE|nr:odorant binging protein [Agrilus zanthoxylumi]
MKILLFLLSCAFISNRIEASPMNEAQLANAAKLIRNVCQPKLKISDKLIENMHKGDFPENEKVMCYLECVLRMGQLMKNGKFDEKSALSQIPTLPPERQQPTRDSIKKCAEKGQNDDKCLAAFETAKCIYFDNPENYFLP